jgi:hypothetical protein
LVLESAPGFFVPCLPGVDCWQFNLGVTIAAYILAFVKVKRWMEKGLLSLIQHLLSHHNI